MIFKGELPQDLQRHKSHVQKPANLSCTEVFRFSREGWLAIVFQIDDSMSDSPGEVEIDTRLLY